MASIALTHSETDRDLLGFHRIEVAPNLIVLQIHALKLLLPGDDFILWLLLEWVDGNLAVCRGQTHLFVWTLMRLNLNIAFRYIFTWSIPTIMFKDKLSISRVLYRLCLTVVCGKSCSNEETVVISELFTLINGSFYKVTHNYDRADLNKDHNLWVQEDDWNRNERKWNKCSHVTLIRWSRTLEIYLHRRLTHCKFVIRSELSTKLFQSAQLFWTRLICILCGSCVYNIDTPIVFILHLYYFIH